MGREQWPSVGADGVCEACARGDPCGRIHNGQRVELVGCHADSSLSHKCGRVVTFMPEKGRYKVALDDDGPSVILQCATLLPLSDNAADDDEEMHQSGSEADSLPTALAFAVTHQKLESVPEQLLRQRASPDSVAPSADQEMTVLAKAAQQGRADIVRALLDAASPDLCAPTETEGRTPLHWACLARHEECVRILLAAKASLDAVALSPAQRSANVLPHRSPVVRAP